VVAVLDDPLRLIAGSRLTDVACLRTSVGLLGFLNLDVVEAIFTKNPYEFLGPEACWREAWSATAGRVAALAPEPPTGLSVRSADPELEAWALESLPSRELLASYLASGYRLGMAPCRSLLTPQFDLDLELVTKLRDGFGNAPTTEALFKACFPVDDMDQPIIRGNEVIFSSQKRNLACSPVPNVSRLPGGAYQVWVVAECRPNFVQIAEHNGELVVCNGVHRAAAMHLAGVEEIPCLWRSVSQVEEIGIDEPGSKVMMTQLLGNDHRRAAKLVDYFDPLLATPIGIRTMDLVMRISVEAELLTVPRARK
jgi:hypothetical protein